MNESDKGFPEIIYKYRNWTDENHKKVITQNQLYFSPIKLFNDPFDSRIPTDFGMLDTDERKMKYAKEIVERNKASLTNYCFSVDSEVERIYNLLKNDLSTQQKRFEDIEVETSNRDYGVLSLSKRWNSILMWSHYSDSHKGYCIGFNWEKLRKHSVHFRSDRIYYSDDYPHIDPLEQDHMVNAWKRWQYKAKDWEYEKEYRIVKGLHMGDEERLYNFPDDYVAEIILGLNIEPSAKKEIVDIAKEKGVPVFQIKRVPFIFKLERERII